MERRPLRGRCAPCTRPVEEAVAEDDACDARRRKDQALERRGTFSRNAGGALGFHVERVVLSVRLGAGRIGEGDALCDDAVGTGGDRRRDKVLRTDNAEPGVRFQHYLTLGGVVVARQVGQLMDDHLRPGRDEGDDRSVAIGEVDDRRRNALGGEFLRPLGAPSRSGDGVAVPEEERHQPPADGTGRARKKYPHGHPHCCDALSGFLGVGAVPAVRTGSLPVAIGIPSAIDHPSVMMKPPRLACDFFARSVHEVAPDLVGATFLVDGVGGVIVEVEAYHHTDPAAHSYGGRNERNAVMFGPPGYAYVYRSYGIHWCVNFVCEGKGSASAVLIRALHPTRGLDRMRERRGITGERQLCSGPGKLCQALAITRAHNGLRLDRAPLYLQARATVPDITVGPRIGISKAVDHPWRYGLAGSPFLSKPFPNA